MNSIEFVREAFESAKIPFEMTRHKNDEEALFKVLRPNGKEGFYSISIDGDRCGIYVYETEPAVAVAAIVNAYVCEEGMENE